MEKPQFSMEDFKIGWLSALPVELAAAIAALDEEYQEVPQGVKRSDLYTLGRIGQHKIVVACVPDSLSSMMSTAAVAYEVRRMFPCIRFWLMVGTGGDVPQDETALQVSGVAIGDVVISDANMQDRGVTQYDLEKTDFSGRYVKTGSLKKPPAVLLDALLKLREYDPKGPRRGWVHLNSGYSDSFRRFDELWWNTPLLLRASNFRFDPIPRSIYEHLSTPNSTWKEVALGNHLLRIYFGRIASVNRALIERASRERLSLEFGGVDCFDTEAFGLITEFPCLIIRGIHDYAVSQRYCNNQPYAAAAAALCAKKYLALILSEDVAETPVSGNMTATSNYDPGTPIRKLKEFKFPEEPNILILGEAGVGKATFINAFVNYLQYETLDESIRAKRLQCVVPHAFTLQYVDISTPNRQIVSRKIRVGPTGDQRDSTSQHLGTQIIHTGVSSTKSNLIDTPSIGGEFAIEQDRQNIDSIMSTLATFDKLHGVLILLKANQSCLSDTFRRYMNEFFTRLHKDAAKNIVFCFTHARPVKYEPGVTIKLLREMLYQYEGAGITLGKNRFYCFDSESFRFLAAQQNGLSMGSAEDFAASWQQSAKEVRRLLQHFQSREPHVVKLSINLNAPRLLFVNRYTEAKKELWKKKQEREDLRKQLHVHTRFVSHVLENPRMVCRKYDCMIYKYDSDGKFVADYKKICHDPCYLEDQSSATGIGQVYSCEIFSSGHCTKCRHHWRHHIHTGLQEKEIYMKDVMGLKANAKEIAAVESKIDDVEAAIYKASDKDRRVLRSDLASRDSITPYSDANFKYLDYLLQQELEKAKALEKAEGESFLPERSPPEPEEVLDIVTKLARPTRHRRHTLFNTFTTDQSVGITAEQSVVLPVFEASE